MELGLCLGRQNKAEEALSAFSRAVEIQPNAIQAHIHWASALRLLGRNQEAIERLEQALTISTNSIAAHLNMARFQTPGKIGKKSSITFRKSFVWIQIIGKRLTHYPKCKRFLLQEPN